MGVDWRRYTYVLSVVILSCQVAQAQTEAALYNFKGGSDGANPQSRLTSDGAGNFYGTTYGGGLGAGTVFELSPNGGGGWNETVIHSFNGGLNIGPDGSGPSGPVIFDNLGNLYGTTRFGGTDYFYCSYGTVFELSRGQTGWTETIPYSINCNYFTNGIFPMNGVIMDLAGKLYGTTTANGPVPGAVFELSPSGGGWTYQSIYDAPTSSGLTMDAAGNIFGVTSSTVFEVSPNGNGGWNPTVIHTFAGYPNDGIGAQGTLVLDQAGSLYGTTYEGGATNHGTVYKLSPGENGEWTEEILYSFKGGKDGANPAAGIVFDAAGNIYGTTELGGSKNKGQGTVFELVALGSFHYEHTVLWTFSGTDGQYPLGSLILDSANILYGTTNSGGSSNAGVVFEVTFDRTPPVITLSATPNILWPPNGKMVPVTISGRITDTGSGVNVNSAAYAVKDEYGAVQPKGAVTLGPGGAYSFTILLQASRLGTDLDGRRYTITVRAEDNAGNKGSKTSAVTVPHDQRD